ncbi:hypothetical protein T492DRAFT_1050270 [Pavlovales sp. CCMP2436]|nr:hypothetical protein T492DRAFT_1050270 [Pavlovales sp. CCMP2436]
MMLLFATMLLLLSRAVTGAVSRGGEQHAETPLKTTKATTTMLLPAATAVCALAAARCCPLEVLAGTSRPPVSLGSSSGCASRAAATKATTMLLPAAAAVCALAASRCCPLEVLAGTSRPSVSLGSSSGSTKTMLLPAIRHGRAAAAETRPRRGVGAGAHTLTSFGVSAGA